MFYLKYNKIMKKDIIDSGFILYKPQENDVLVLLKENLMSLTINGQEMLCCRAEILRNEKSSFQLVLFSQFMPKRIETENETITNTSLNPYSIGRYSLRATKNKYLIIKHLT